MASESDRRADEIFYEALNRLGEDRIVFLEEACGEDDVLRAEVQSLLAAYGDASSFFDRESPAVPREEPLQRKKRQFGHFTLGEELGRGGQGSVYLAEDSRLKRRVALKILSLPFHASESALERFEREGQAASRLEHPGICTIHEAGEVQGVPYLAMQYVEGETLAEFIESAHSSPSTAADSDHIARMLQLFELVARALHHAHEAGLVHRDIKPGNIMLSQSGSPVILDFGLVRDLEGNEPTLTRTGDVLGTPYYMSPEQITETAAVLDRRTDVYSLGVTLYECLTFRRPFEAATRDALCREILDSEHPDPRSGNSRITRDLAVVLDTALEKNLERRYQTALDFAEDLRRVREREPIRARPAGPFLRLGRFAQRNPVLATSTVGVILLLTVALGISFLFLAQLRTEQRHLKAGGLITASKKVSETNSLLALLLTRAAVETDRTTETISQLHVAVASSFERACLDHESAVSGAEFYSDDLLLTVAGAAVHVWDENGKRTASIEHSGRVNNATFSAVGQRVLTASEDGTARLTNLSDLQRVEFRHNGSVTMAVFSPRPGLIFTTSRDMTAKLWDETGTCLQTLPHDAPILHGDVTSAGDMIVTAGEDGTMHIWSRTEDTWRAKPIVAHSGGVEFVRISPDAQKILSYGVGGKTPRIWDRDGSEIRSLVARQPVQSAEFSPSGNQVVTAALDFRVRAWGTQKDSSDEDAIVYEDEPDGFNSASYSPNGELLVLATELAAAKIIDLNGMIVANLAGHDADVLGARFSPSGLRVVTYSEDGSARVWEPFVKELPSFPASFPMASYSPNGRCVVTGGFQVRRWDKHGKLLKKYVADEEVGADDPSDEADDRAKTRFVDVAMGDDWIGAITNKGRIVVWDYDGALRTDLDVDSRRVAFAPDGAGLLTWKERAGRVQHWRRGTWQPSYSHPNHVSHVAFLSSGKEFLCSTRGGIVNLWRIGESQPRHTYQHSKGTEVDYVSSSKDGRLVFSACDDGRAFVWNRDEPNKPRRAFLGHEKEVWCVEYCDEQELVVTSSSDGTVRLWKLNEDEPRVVIPVSPSGVGRVVFSPSGDRILTSRSEGARAWCTGAQELLRLANELAYRSLTKEERERYPHLLAP